MALTAQRRTSSHHKKIRGEHHQHSKHYLKTYSPYLPLLMLVIIGLAINSFWANKPHVLGAATNLTASQLLQDSNVERTRQQKPDLTVSTQLTAAAQAKANDMVQHNYWSHNAPNGNTPWDFVLRSGYDYQAAGENLAYGFSNAQTLLNGWMNSPEHRANVLNADFQNVGFGVANAQNFQGKGPTTVVVAIYGEPASAGASELSSTLTTQPARTVARIQGLTGSTAPWSLALLSALTLLALVVFMFRHVLAWHRVLVRSEVFVVKHKAFDVIIVSAAIAGFILTRTAGFIG